MKTKHFNLIFFFPLSNLIYTILHFYFIHTLHYGIHCVKLFFLNSQYQKNLLSHSVSFQFWRFCVLYFEMTKKDFEDNIYSQCYRTVLYNIGATSHMWLFKFIFKLSKIKWNRNFLPQSHWPHIKHSIHVIGDYHNIYWSY